MKLAFLIALAFSQVLLASDGENQCRQEAKEIALKTFETCMTGKKAEQINQLKQEYQEKALQLKSEYEQKIREASDSETSTETAEIPMTIDQEMAESEPTVTLKPAKSVTTKKAAAPQNKTRKEKLKKNLKAASPKNLEMVDPSLAKE